MMRLLTLFLLTSCACSGLTLGPGGSLSFAGSGWVVLVGVNGTGGGGGAETWLNATMTGDTAPSPNTVTSDYSVLWVDKYKAFDHNSATYAELGGYTSGPPSDLIFYFGSGNAKVVSTVKIKCDGAGNAIKNFTINSSNNGLTWYNLYTGIQPNDASVQSYSIATSTAYAYWQVKFTSAYTSPGNVRITEIEIWGTP